MIKKLKSKIFLILMISLSVITIGVVVLFTISNYRNTINTSAVFMDRFLKPNSSQGPNGEKNNPQNDEQMGINENQNSNPSGNPNNSQNEILPFPETTDQNNNITAESRETSSNDIQQVAIDGFYRVKVSTDGSVTDANQENANKNETKNNNNIAENNQNNNASSNSENYKSNEVEKSNDSSSKNNTTSTTEETLKEDSITIKVVERTETKENQNNQGNTINGQNGQQMQGENSQAQGNSQMQGNNNQGNMQMQGMSTDSTTSEMKRY